MSTSQNGWPALGPNSPKLISWNIPGSGVKLRLRNGSAGFLLIHCGMWFDKVVEDIDKGKDDWGHAYRMVRGYSTTLSNHSSGTAIDLNATQHVLGKEDTFSKKEEKLILARMDFYEGCIRWGGQYRGRKDEMHFEINQPMHLVEKRARELMDSPRGEKILKLNPGQRKVILS